MPELGYPDPPLGDEHVLLRPWTAADMPATAMAFGDPSVQRFSWPRVTAYTERDAHAFFAHQQEARRRGEELNFAFVEPRDRDIVLGGGSVYDIDREHSRAAVGYWLATWSRGRGVATHATRLMAG